MAVDEDGGEDEDVITFSSIEEEEEGGLLKKILGVIRSKPFKYATGTLKTVNNWKSLQASFGGETYYFWFAGKAFGETLMTTIVSLNNALDIVPLEPIA